MATDARAQRVRALLEQELAPERLEITDESHRHAGHIGRPRGPEEGMTETHFNVTVVSRAFEGMSRVARSRLVQGLLKPEFEKGLHALALSLHTPEESAAR